MTEVSRLETWTMTSLSDREAMDAIGKSRNMLIPWYLIGAYAYYALDMPVLTDSTFDAICIMLDEEWDDLEHVHKSWVCRDDLSAGTRMSAAYPSMAKGSACARAGVPYHPPVGISGRAAQLELVLGDLIGAIHAVR
jgi:hypothetical protein